MKQAEHDINRDSSKVGSKIKVLFSGLNFPEGPAFASDGSLWLVELKGESLIEYKEEKLIRHRVGGMPNGISIDKNGLIWFCDARHNSIRCLNPANLQTKTVVTHVGEEVLNKPNDLAFDQNGNLVFTCPGNSRMDPTGYACVLMENGSVKKITDGKYFPNGLAFSKDGKSLVIAETYKHRLWKGAWDSNKGEWIGEKVWCEVGGPDGPGGPDGMAFDADNTLYVAVYGTGKIKVINSAGIIVNEILVPGQNPTNCAFDLNERPGLVVTEADKGQVLYIEINKTLE